MTTDRVHAARDCRVVEVIQLILLRGRGSEADPIRTVTRYLDFNGNLLAEKEEMGNHIPYEVVR